MGDTSKLATNPQAPHTAGNLTTSIDRSIYEPNAYRDFSRYPQARTLDGSPTTITGTPPAYSRGHRNSMQYPGLHTNTSEHTGEGNEGDGRRRPGNASRNNSYDQQSAGVSAATPDPHNYQCLPNNPRHTDNRHEDVGHAPSLHDQQSRELISVDLSQEDLFADRRGGDGRPAGQELSHRSDGLLALEPLCVVCKKRPQYAGSRRYTTCGLTCGDILKAQSGAVRGGSRQICVVCGIRPQHAPYPTCGLTCAAKLKGSSDRDHGSSPDLSQGQQGQQMADLIPSITYSACLMCWSSAQQNSSEFCSTSCQEAAQDKGPILLEALRGHVTFQKISELFNNTWKTSKPCPEVLKVYKIVENKSHAATYEKFRKAHAKSHEQRRWHGISCECDVGDRDKDFCDSLECQLCQTVLHSFDTSKFKSGVHTSETSSQSSIYSDDDNSTEKTMLLTDVCFGEQISLARDEIPPEGVKNHDTVQILKRPLGGQSPLVDDVIVYKTDAIRPSYVVFYG